MADGGNRLDVIPAEAGIAPDARHAIATQVAANSGDFPETVERFPPARE
jgi:hypothetical protein